MRYVNSNKSGLTASGIGESSREELLSLKGYIGLKREKRKSACPVREEHIQLADSETLLLLMMACYLFTIIIM